MTKYVRNLGDFDSYAAAEKKKGQLSGIVKQAAAKSKGNYSLKITNPKTNQWTIWLMKE